MRTIPLRRKGSVIQSGICPVVPIVETVFVFHLLCSRLFPGVSRCSSLFCSQFVPALFPKWIDFLVAQFIVVLRPGGANGPAATIGGQSTLGFETPSFLKVFRRFE